MTEFQELTKNAPNFASMEHGELVTYAYGLYAAGTKTDAENTKLRALFTDFWKWADPPFALKSGTFEQFMEICDRAYELSLIECPA